LSRKDNVGNLTKNHVGVLTKKIEEMMLQSKEQAQKLHYKTKESIKTRGSLSKMFDTLQLFAKDLERTNRSLRKENSGRGLNSISTRASPTTPSKDVFRGNRSSNKRVAL